MVSYDVWSVESLHVFVDVKDVIFFISKKKKDVIFYCPLDV